MCPHSAHAHQKSDGRLWPLYRWKVIDAGFVQCYLPALAGFLFLISTASPTFKSFTWPTFSRSRSDARRLVLIPMVNSAKSLGLFAGNLRSHNPNRGNAFEGLKIAVLGPIYGKRWGICCRIFTFAWRNINRRKPVREFRKTGMQNQFNVMYAGLCCIYF